MVGDILAVLCFIFAILNLFSTTWNLTRLRATERKYKEANETCSKAWELYREASKRLSVATSLRVEAEELRAKAEKHLSKVEAIHRGDQAQNN